MMRARSSAWIWLVYTSSSGSSAGVPLLQALQRQAVAPHKCRARAGCQAARRRARAHARSTALGIDPAPARGVARRDRPRLVDQRAAAVAVHAGGADINEASRARVKWRSDCGCGGRSCHPTAAAPDARCSCARPRQPRQAGRLVEVGDDRHRAGRAQFGAARRLAGDGKHAKAVAQQRQQAHADIAAAEDQQARPLPNFLKCLFFIIRIV